MKSCFMAYFKTIFKIHLSRDKTYTSNHNCNRKSRPPPPPPPKNKKRFKKVLSSNQIFTETAIINLGLRTSSK